jgi:hypothetical protein
VHELQAAFRNPLRQGRLESAMNIKLLVDAIVQQTTVLIAQLATNAGVRAPLAHLADQVFLSLSREIEAQGVGRKVAADMFGLALRGYQKKTRRAAASASIQDKTLFEAILQHVESEQGASREALLRRFRRDNEREVIGVVNDLVQSGLLYATGSGGATLYGVTSEAERQKFTRHSDTEALASMALGAIYRCPGVTTDELCEQLRVERDALEHALLRLRSESRVSADPAGRWSAATFQIPVGAEHGWEAAVFDHFQAVATAISNKVQLRSARLGHPERIGGTTLRFEVSRSHPELERVLGLLQSVRELTDRVWDAVNAHNTQHPIAEQERINVSFYFGQNTDELSLLSPESGSHDTEDDLV